MVQEVQLRLHKISTKPALLFRSEILIPQRKDMKGLKAQQAGFLSKRLDIRHGIISAMEQLESNFVWSVEQGILRNIQGHGDYV
jgi:hypothetical protein